MMRVVLDTNVIISAFLWGGPPARLLTFGPTNDLEFFTSAPLITELSDTMSRRKFLSKVAMTGRSATQLVSRYSSLAIHVIPAQTPRLAPDPDDDVVIGTAIAAKAKLLVTGDQALLSVSTFDGGRIVSVKDSLTLCRLTD